MRVIKKGTTVRLRHIGTPSQRQTVWVAAEDFRGYFGTVEIYRQSDPDSRIKVSPKYLREATVLDFLVD